MSNDLKTIPQRTKYAREQAGFLEVKDFVEALNNSGYAISYPRYYTYENRSPIAHELIFPFCKLTNTRSEWLLTGQGARERPQNISKEEQFLQMLEEMKNYFDPKGSYNFSTNNIITDIKKKDD